MTTRINPSTGVIEEANAIEEALDAWHPADNENGNMERINPETGVVEEASALESTFDFWHSKK
jgi:hypothetical protein